MIASGPAGRVVVVLAVVVALLASACAGEPTTGTIEWRDLEVTVPDGWKVYEQGPTVLGVADGDLGDEGARGARRVAAQFTWEEGAVSQPWRDLVASRDGEIEVDEQFDVGGLPATRLQWLWNTNGVLTRESVVVVPSRGVVVLYQPVIEVGETDGPDRFVAHVEEFLDMIGTIVWGRPIE